MVQLLNNTILFYLYLVTSIEIQFKIFGNNHNYLLFINLGGFEDNASLFFAPLNMYSSTPSESRKKNILIHFTYILIRNEKYNTENIDYFYAKFDDFYPLKSFLPSIYHEN